MFKQKAITDSSWVILNSGSPFGILRKLPKGYNLLVGEEKFEFDTLADFEKMFGALETVVHQTKEVIIINGFPAMPQHRNAVAIDDTSPNYKNGGNIVFVAGFLALKFANAKSWQVVNGIKQSTVDTTETVGPFKTKFEAQSEANIRNTS